MIKRKRITKAVFPVAGLGTRFLPATKVIPKEMLPVVDRPLIQYAMEEAREAGITDFIFVTNNTNRPLLERYFGDNESLNATLSRGGKIAELKLVSETVVDPRNLHFCIQEQPLGLGHAVWCAYEFVAGEPFAVILPDDLIQAKPGCLTQMLDVWCERGGNVVAVEDVPRDRTNRYGILDVVSDDGRIASARGLVEKPAPKDAPSTLSIIGRYILDEAVFDHLNKSMAGAGGEIQLTDAISATIGTGKGQVPFHGLRFDGTRFDCGSMTGFVEANVALALASSEYKEYLRERLKRHL
ncbi:MAG: UTP--glucose-1-phosphate uridylyltransferase [Rhodospirillaceae bacterium]|nr:UTP--glucose-1-phosphate uridylyltransferase [Rhodospirillaceae bacterium]